MNSQTVRHDLAVAFSLATLSTIRVWLPVWNECYGRSYMMKTSVSTAYVLASLVTLCALAAGIFAVGQIVRRHSSRHLKSFGQAATICALCVPLNALRSVFGAEHYALSRYAISTSFGTWLGPVIIAAAFGTGCAFWRFRATLARFAYAGLLLMFPLAPLNLLHLAWAESTRQAQTPDTIAGRMGGDQAKTRVVWILFDEWDYDLTFEHRPANLMLPQLDRLRSESLFASNTSSPSWQTRVSVPALTTGLLLRSVAEKGRSDASLAPAGGKPEVLWSEASTMFSDARAMGFDTSIAGSYLPYCRVLGGELSSCWWSEAPNLVSSTGSSVPAIALNQARSLFETQNFSPFGTSVLSAGYVRMYEDVLAHAESTLRNQETGLVYFHFPIPHPPTIYDASTGDTRVRSAGARGYIDNLVLVDKTIKRLREQMVADGQWEHTTLVLTSDHWYREASLLHGRRDTRVPFILKLGGDASPAPMGMPLNNVLGRDLVAAVLRGQIRTNAEAAKWLAKVSENSDGTAQESIPPISRLRERRHEDSTHHR